MSSLWTETVTMPQFSKMTAPQKTDVLIIGGGITGILCGYFLQNAGVDYILVEKDRICNETSGNTTAKITSQHGLIYQNLINQGIEYAQKYLEINQAAIEEYAVLCKKIPCDFERKPSYVYSLHDKNKLLKELNALEKIGYSASFEENINLPFQTAGAIRFENQAQFHPLKFVSGIAKNLQIFEKTFVKELAPHTAKTTRGEITYDKLIVATHFPIDNKLGMYSLKMYQHRSYVIALKDGPQIDGMYVDEAMKGMSFRNYKNYLLIGGGDHRTGKQGGNWEELREIARNYYPDLKEDYYWAAQDCMSLDEVPYIGNYSPNMQGCYTATGFNKWGITSSMVSAMILTDLILEKYNPYAEIFNPSRNMLKPQLFINTGEAVLNLLSFSRKRCPHLGCSLKWNPDEHSWDCPCHGSRFTEHGKLLDNPANGDADWK